MNWEITLLNIQAVSYFFHFRLGPTSLPRHPLAAAQGRFHSASRTQEHTFPQFCSRWLLEPCYGQVRNVWSSSLLWDSYPVWTHSLARDTSGQACRGHSGAAGTSRPSSEFRPGAYRIRFYSWAIINLSVQVSHRHRNSWKAHILPQKVYKSANWNESSVEWTLVDLDFAFVNDF